MAFTRERAKALVIAYLTKRSGRRVSEKTNLRKDLGLSAAALRSLGSDLGKQYDIAIGSAEIAACVSVGDLIDTFWEKARAAQKAKAPAKAKAKPPTTGTSRVKRAAPKKSAKPPRKIKKGVLLDAAPPEPFDLAPPPRPRRDALAGGGPPPRKTPSKRIEDSFLGSPSSGARPSATYIPRFPSDDAREDALPAGPRPGGFTGGGPGSAPPLESAAPDAVPPASAPSELDKAEYRVWYGTNRKPRDSNDIQKGYLSDRDKKTHYGWCRVYVPESHKIGSLGSSWFKRLVTWTDDRLKLLETAEQTAADYWKHLSAQIAKTDIGERHAVIFIHGYRVSFEDAALRAAQIGFDLQIKGAMAFFSWPSKGDLDSYVADSATIEASESVIADFMIDFAQRSGAEAVHVIAHSMGNRGVLRAVNRIAGRAQTAAGVPFGQVVLAAADVDADTFQQLCAAYQQVARRTTLYVSARDRAVEASEWLHKYARAGLLPPICVAPGIDTINVTNVDLSWLGHGYIGEARDLLHDINQLIRKNTPPGERLGLREQKTDTGDKYWLIGA